LSWQQRRQKGHLGLAIIPSPPVNLSRRNKTGVKENRKSKRERLLRPIGGGRKKEKSEL
jgi:hypothetical protein